MEVENDRVMRGSAFRALCVAGLFAFAANSASAAVLVDQGGSQPLDLTAYRTVLDDAGPTVVMPAESFGPPHFETNWAPAAMAHVPLASGIALDLGSGDDLFGATKRSGPTDGLFLSAAANSSPYDALADGGAYVGTTLTLADDVHVSLGDASLQQGAGEYPANFADALVRLGDAPKPFDLRSANAMLAGVSLDVAPWGDIGFTASKTNEQNGALGLFDPSLRSSDTEALGVSAQIQLGGGWMTTASFAQAVTKLDLKPGLGSDLPDLRTRSYGLAVAKRGVFGNDVMGLAVSRPEPASSEFALVSGVNGQPQYLSAEQFLQGTAPETDFELGYVTTFLDGAVALQANASYQMNFAGQTGNNAVSLLSRAKIKF
jgi:hypothetical protein